MRSITWILPALLAVAACDGGTQGAGTTTEEAEAAGNVVGNSSASKPSGEPGTASESSPRAAIPAAIRGRWGLVRADCTTTRGDDKGLLTITSDSLEFYESVATLDAVAEAEPERIRASFDFEGEGMTWERQVELLIEADGETLIRREHGEDAAPEPFRYTRCPGGDPR